jgi:hypothetical protein
MLAGRSLDLDHPTVIAGIERDLQRDDAAIRHPRELYDRDDLQAVQPDPVVEVAAGLVAAADGGQAGFTTRPPCSRVAA